jgi:hypothetical protein
MKPKPVVKSKARVVAKAAKQPAVKAKAAKQPAVKTTTVKRRGRKRLPIDLAMLKKLWRDGLAVTEIAKKLGGTPSSIYYKARATGLSYVDRAGRQIPASTVKKLTSLPSWRVRAIALQSRGWTPSAIAKQLGVGIAEVNVFLKYRTR